MLELIKRLLDWRPVDLVKPGRLGLLAGAALVGVLSASPALATHNLGLFELDTGAVCDSVACGAANVKDDPAGKPDDWANVFCTKNPGDSNCAGIGTDSALVRTFVKDQIGSKEDSFFTGGGSKDEEAINQDLGANKSWEYDNENDVIPDKDDISNAFAAAYKNPANGHTIFYFGSDRFDTNGSSQMGFWFFRSEVKLGTKPKFEGKHSEGDILVLVDFLQGGQVGQLTVYKVASVSAQGVPIFGAPFVDKTQADCATAGANDAVCGVINNIPGETPPWPYTNKDGQSSYQKGALLEAGFDFNVLFPNETFGCFSSFLAETRSSHSLSAQLKDFALGKFEVCNLEVTKAGTELSKIGDIANYTITIKNTGQATLYKQTITDDVLNAITTNGVDVANPNVLSNTCGASLAPGASCVVTLKRTVQAGDPDQLTNTASVTYTEKQDFSGVALARTSNHDVNLFQPSITLSKTASSTLIKRGGTVNYEVKLTNTSSSDTPPLNCTITDLDLGISDTVTGLLPNASHAVPTIPPVTFTDPDNISFCKSDVAGWICTNTAKVDCHPQGFTNQLHKEASATVTVQPPLLKLTVVKTGAPLAKAGDKVTYTITINNLSDVTVTLLSIDDSLLGNLLSKCPDPLAVGGHCTINVDRTVQTGDPDPLINTVTVSGKDVFGTVIIAPPASHTVDLVHPDFTVTKDCVSQPVPAGASANFRIKITNGQIPAKAPFGDVPLVLDILDSALNPPVNQTGVKLGLVAGSCADSDYDGNAADGCYLIEGSIIATGTEVANEVKVTATLDQTVAPLPNIIEKSAKAICKVQQGGATRTPGFWKTHGGLDGYTCHVFDKHLGDSASLGWITLNSCEDALGVFWSSTAKNTDGSKRSQICQATRQASFQLLAALLNQGLDNGAPIPIDPKSGLDIITAEQKALSACYDSDVTTVCDRNNILRLQGLLGTFNGSGDDTAIIDNDGTVIKHADPKDSHAIANTSVADCSSK